MFWTEFDEPHHPCEGWPVWDNALGAMMQIERLYYDERWKMWKVEIHVEETVYVLPLSVVIIFVNRLFAMMKEHLTSHCT